MTSLSVRLTIFVALIGVSSGRGETPLHEARSTLDKWVETRQLISKSRSDWQSDKEMLEQSVQLFERELKSVDEQMAKLGTNSTQVEKERLSAEALLKSSNEGLEQAKLFATEIEGRIIKLTPQLPSPLQEIIRPLLNRMPTNSATTRMPVTERVQVVVGILNELDKFNNAVTIFNEKRKNEKNEEVAVETVYVGLGAAYFVNDLGNFAGMGFPGPDGWQWTVKPELSSSVKEVIRIYRNEHPARFVSLPIAIQ
jgi:hypothetical protein